MFENIVKNYSLAEKIYGKSFLRNLVDDDDNLNLPEVRQNLKHKIKKRIENLEEELVKNPQAQTLHKIHDFKREMIYLRKAVWPLREVISAMERKESPLIRDTTSIYLRDVYDHTIQVIDTIESYREMLSGMLDIYLSSISNRMNEIMKFLTVIGTIFIPLTFIVGIYGMNFEFMPELKWRYGYFILLGFMVCVTVGMLAYFKRKKWI